MQRVRAAACGIGAAVGRAAGFAASQRLRPLCRRRRPTRTPRRPARAAHLDGRWQNHSGAALPPWARLQATERGARGGGHGCSRLHQRSTGDDQSTIEHTGVIAQHARLVRMSRGALRRPRGVTQHTSQTPTQPRRNEFETLVGARAQKSPQNNDSTRCKQRALETQQDARRMTRCRARRQVGRVLVSRSAEPTRRVRTKIPGTAENHSGQTTTPDTQIKRCALHSRTAGRTCWGTLQVTKTY